MSNEALDPRYLYAAVPAEDAKLARAAGRGLTVVVAGATAAVTGKRPPGSADTLALAMAHDRVMQRLMARCSSVLPFRLGVAAPAADELRRIFHGNSIALVRQLARFHDRVEMGLKIKAKESGTTFDLGPVHTVVSDREDRLERVAEQRGAAVFEGVYLVKRASIEEFWAAVERIRDASPELPILGVGPFAPYSFCDIRIDASGISQEID